MAKFIVNVHVMLSADVSAEIVAPLSRRTCGDDTFTARLNVTEALKVPPVERLAGILVLTT